MRLSDGMKQEEVQRSERMASDEGDEYVGIYSQEC